MIYNIAKMFKNITLFRILEYIQNIYYELYQIYNIKCCIILHNIIFIFKIYYINIH